MEDSRNRTAAEGGAGETPASREDARYEALRQRYDALWRDYRALADSRLGRLTLRWWEKKDRLRAGLRGLGTKGPVQSLEEGDLPTVTVILPTYRPQPYLREAVSSALAQDYPPEKLRLILAVNGPDEAYLRQLREEYGQEGRIRMVHTAKQSVGAARNLALRETDTDCVCYLDDDDRLTPGFVRLLASRMAPGVTVACGPLADLRPGSGEADAETYVNRALRSIGEGAYRRSLLLSPLLSTLPGKLYRTELLRGFAPMDETLPNSEDVVYWAENYRALRGRICLCPPEKGESYLRRLTPGSLSRPRSRDRAKFYVSDRLEVLERLHALLDKAASREERSFLRGKIRDQEGFLKSGLGSLESGEREEALAMLAGSPLGAALLRDAGFPEEKETP